MYENLGAQPGVQRPPTNSQPNPFGDAFSGAGSGLIRNGLGAYGEKLFGSSSEYVQSNVRTMLWQSNKRFFDYGPTFICEIRDFTPCMRESQRSTIKQGVK